MVVKFKKNNSKRIQKRQSASFTLLRAIFLSSLVVMAAAALITAVLVQGKRPIGVERIVLMEQGIYSAEALRTELRHKGIFPDSVAEYWFYCYFWLDKLLTQHKVSKYKISEYQIKSSDSWHSILHKLQTNQVFLRKITFPEGFSVFQILNRAMQAPSLQHDLPLLTPEEMARYEGWLMPDTYFYHYGMKTSDIIEKMRGNMVKFLEKAWKERDKSIDNCLTNPEAALILASIVESETALSQERPVVAGVYLNRLRRGMRLQSCPTIRYALTRGNFAAHRTITYADLQHSSPYNTYLRYGLPPSPICNPSREAILAVLHPSYHEYLFFVKRDKNTQDHYFAKNFAEHIENKRRFMQSFK